jgi:hypothetical protein
MKAMSFKEFVESILNAPLLTAAMTEKIVAEHEKILTKAAAEAKDAQGKAVAKALADARSSASRGR